MSLLNKFFTFLAKATAPAPKKVSTRGIVVSSEDIVKNEEVVSKSRKVESYKLAWKDVPNEEKQKDLELIQSEIMVKGYKAIPEILAQYRNEMVQHFVMIQLIQLGQYNPEVDNLEQYTMVQLVDMAVENNQLMFEQRMFETGKAFITKAQKDILAKNGVKENEMPKDKFSASRLIDTILKSKGIDTSKPRTNTPSQAQINKISELCTKLTIETPMYTTGSDASAVIGTLLEAVKKAGLEDKASEKQIELAKRLTKQLNKRWTAKRELAITSMTKSELSKEINTMQEDFNKLHPEATEGQIDYMINLMQMLGVPYNVLEVKAMSKIDATIKLNMLRKDYLYKLTRVTNPSLTKVNIASMSTEAVKTLIDTIKHENKTRDLTKDAEFDTNMSLGDEPF